MKPYRDIVYPQDGSVAIGNANSVVSMAGANATAGGPNADGDINANILPPSISYLLLDGGTYDGDFLLLDGGGYDGDKLILEGAAYA